MKLYRRISTFWQGIMRSGSVQDNRVTAFKEQHEYDPDLAEPSTFSEKLLKRILQDDDPFYHLYGTKLQVPYFLKARKIPGLHFPERLKVCSKLMPSDFSDLPPSFVVKSSFGSGLNWIVKNSAHENLEEICDHFNTRIGNLKNARGHTAQDNCIIIEEFLAGPDGESPADLKFHCFHRDNGEFHHILQFDTQRSQNHEQSLFDSDYQRLPFSFADTPQHDAIPAKPAFLRDAVRIARQASEGFDYIRVDLYILQNKVYFGEFTPFHQGGKGRINPRDWDGHLGRLWDFRMPAFQERRL